jgi:hypothetical protein
MKVAGATDVILRVVFKSIAEETKLETEMSFEETAGWLFGFGYASIVGHGSRGLLSDSDETFLADQARRICASAELRPGQSNGGWRNLTPYTLHVPGGNMGYHAYWVRDAVMMLESGLISSRELEGWIRFMSSIIINRNWNVRPGVIVPAFSIPDHINLDGNATYYPGNYEVGDKQGGSPWGKYPPLDDQFYYISAVYFHWKQTGSTALFRSQVKTKFGAMRLSELCENAYRSVPCDPATALCRAGDPSRENAKDWGFCDAESKSGKLLFPSVLKLVAARQMAELFNATGSPLKAAGYRSDVGKIKAAITSTFLHPSSKADECWLDSATEVGHQPDVWGSAYAVYSNAVDDATAGKISRALVRAYREKTAVRNGWVSQLLWNDAMNPKGWQMSVSPWGEYQNGAYWGTPVGWYLVAMRKADEQASADMARDYIEFLRKNRDFAGTSKAWEWFNPDTGKSANPLYAATVVLPYGCLRSAGLLRRKAQ